MDTHSEAVQSFRLLMAQKRRSRRVTLRALARSLDMNDGGHSHLSRIERGLTEPLLGLAVAIAEELDIDLEVLKS